MAQARRIAQSSVNWAALAERVPAAQKVNFANFKSKSDIYLRSVLANPETAPVIDWAFYKRLIPITGLVDNFEQSYKALKVPYPTENSSQLVEAQAKETKTDISEFVKSSNERICGYEKDIGHLKSLLPYDQMTMEDYRDAFPEEALDPINRPTFWPHTKEEQVGYKAKDGPVHDH